MSEEKRQSRLRNLCLTDLFFLLRYALNRPDVDHDWLFDRCREVQASPNGHLDLWAREHYKSTIITVALTIQDILNNPEITIGIFSHTRPTAKAFLRQIKREFEANDFLKSLFPDILWENPQKQSSKWSEDEGIVVKRKTNPKESTVEAWGLVDGQPTSKHYKLMVYDDVVVPESVTTTEMIAKTTNRWELSDNLGASGGFVRVVGTRYHFSDTYATMMKRNVVKPRIYPCTHDGTETGDPVLKTRKEIDKKRRKQGPYTFGTQMLLDPKGDSKQGFNREWLKYYKNMNPDGLNIYIVCDPANSKKKDSDFTVIEVVGLGPDENYYTLDVIRDRLNLTERTEALIRLHRKWRPIATGYEKYGKDADIEHIEHVQEQKNYRFDITPLGGSTRKEDRIAKLIPVFERGDWYLPEQKPYTNWEGRLVDLTEQFIEEEYVAFPVSQHDDMLDCKARILDPALGAEFPDTEEWKDDDNYFQVTGESSWLGV